jgi:hypothetical protein
VRRSPVADRFWERVEVTDGCWSWLGAINTKGYGLLTVDRRTNLAHRLAYEMLVGPIPDGLHIDHLCRNRSCVNPKHMEPVTPRENVLRGVGTSAQNAAKTHCPEGHPYDYVRRSGRRRCTTCHNEQQRQRRAAQRSAA